MNPFALLRYLALPLHASSLGIIIVFAVMITAAEINGLAGLPLVLILSSWFFKFGFAILDDVIEGRRKPPLLSMEMANPFEMRPLGLLLIVCTFYTLSEAVRPWLNETGVVTVRVVCFAIIPAMISSMAANGRFRDAFDPIAVFGTIARVPLAYALLLVSIGTLWLIAAWLFKSAPFTFDDLWQKENFLPGHIVDSIGFNGLLASLLRLAALMYLWLATFACIGGTIYERRLELGFDAAASPERVAARVSKDLERDRDKIIDRIFAEIRGDSRRCVCERRRSSPRVDRACAASDGRSSLAVRTRRGGKRSASRRIHRGADLRSAAAPARDR